MSPIRVASYVGSRYAALDPEWGPQADLGVFGVAAEHVLSRLRVRGKALVAGQRDRRPADFLDPLARHLGERGALHEVVDAHTRVPAREAAGGQDRVQPDRVVAEGDRRARPEQDLTGVFEPVEYLERLANDHVQVLGGVLVAEGDRVVEV